MDSKNTFILPEAAVGVTRHFFQQTGMSNFEILPTALRIFVYHMPEIQPSRSPSSIFIDHGKYNSEKINMLTICHI